MLIVAINSFGISLQLRNSFLTLLVSLYLNRYPHQVAPVISVHAADISRKLNDQTSSTDQFFSRFGFGLQHHTIHLGSNVSLSDDGYLIIYPPKEGAGDSFIYSTCCGKYTIVMFYKHIESFILKFSL